MSRALVKEEVVKIVSVAMKTLVQISQQQEADAGPQRTIALVVQLKTPLLKRLTELTAAMSMFKTRLAA